MLGHHCHSRKSKKGFLKMIDDERMDESFCRSLAITSPFFGGSKKSSFCESFHHPALQRIWRRLAVPRVALFHRHLLPEPTVFLRIHTGAYAGVRERIAINTMSRSLSLDDRTQQQNSLYEGISSRRPLGIVAAVALLSLGVLLRPLREVLLLLPT